MWRLRVSRTGASCRGSPVAKRSRLLAGEGLGELEEVEAREWMDVLHDFAQRDLDGHAPLEADHHPGAAGGETFDRERSRLAGQQAITY